MSYIEIKITKAVLYLTEKELLSNLPKELIALGLERGKALKRARQMEKRGRRNHNRGRVQKSVRCNKAQWLHN